MNDPAPSKVRRVSDLPREIPPPHDGWPALEARLRASGMPQPDTGVEPGGRVAPARRWRPRVMQIATLAAVLAAVVVGITIDRWILAPGHPAAPVAAVPGSGSADRGIPVSYVTDPRYLHERAELLRTLDARLAKLPPPTRKKVLQSLATIHQSMRDIQQALGREPGNALLQELLIDTYQDEMHVLSTVQQASSGSGET
ncbi:MAG TPA: hypothetical protein VFX20_11290 [Steroidobacteraceae bacterium]|nr:hypothetical protein [Steroidobacteraceae bacterium]